MPAPTTDAAVSALLAIVERAEEAEGVLRLLRHELRELPGDTAARMNDKAWGRLQRQIEMADYVLAQTVDTADASKMGGEREPAPYIPEPWGAPDGEE